MNDKKLKVNFQKILCIIVSCVLAFSVLTLPASADTSLSRELRECYDTFEKVERLSSVGFQPASERNAVSGVYTVR